MELATRAVKFSAVAALLILFLGIGVAQLWAETNSPSALDQLVLSVPSQQLIGRTWTGSAQILFLDENLDLVTDYNLSTDPITITASEGSVSPAVISDSLLFSGGIIDLAALGLIYSGPSGPVTITVSNLSVSSNGVVVAFNGCVISEAVGLATDTISTVYANVSSSVSVVVGNAGGLVATEASSLTAFFRSGGGSTRVEYDPCSSDHLDTVPITLPTTGLTQGTDTLVLVSESLYDLGSGNQSTGDTLRIPIQVQPSDGLTIFPASVSPDSVYAGVPFNLDFAVVASGMQAPFDSAVAVVNLLSDTDSALAVLFEGPLQPDRTDSDTVFYSGLQAEINATPDLAAGQYGLRVDYDLHLGGLAMTAAEPSPDSLFVQVPATFGYVESSLVPNQIASGAEAEFQFELYVEGTETLYMQSDQSSLELSNNGFSVTCHLTVAGDSLIPGSNFIQTDAVYVPVEFLGTNLSVYGTIVYRHVGLANLLSREINFAGETIAVQAVPVVKIIETYVVAPNAPKVNTGQSFCIDCVIANVSTADAEPFELVLATDGSSEFDSRLMTDPISAGDTSIFHFDVVASGVSNEAEIFRVEVAPFSVSHVLPLDNIALATIQRAAELSVSVLLIGVEEGSVDIGEGFDILIGLVNTGDGDATDGRFRINTNGIYLGLPDSALIAEETIATGGVRGISFVAPAFDTTISINIDLVERPIDLNSDLPALIGDTAFQVDLAITSEMVTLNVDLARASSNLVVAGESKELFSLRVSNPGSSSLSDIKLESMVFRFTEPGNAFPNVRSLVEVGSTGLFSGGQKLTSATAGQDRLELSFDDYVIPAGNVVELSFQTKSLAAIDAEYSISLETESIVATYAGGPLAGQAVAAATAGGDQPILNEVFTAVEGNLTNSFVVRHNPYDPTTGPAEFRYYLQQSQRMRLIVLTLSGEVVHEELFHAGAMGGRIGENTVFWNGHNDHGWPVLNGVYVVVVTDEAGQQRSILKLAVMR